MSADAHQPGDHAYGDADILADVRSNLNLMIRPGPERVVGRATFTP